MNKTTSQFLYYLSNRPRRFTETERVVFSYEITERSTSIMMIEAKLPKGTSIRDVVLERVITNSSFGLCGLGDFDDSRVCLYAVIKKIHRVVNDNYKKDCLQFHKHLRSMRRARQRQEKEDRSLEIERAKRSLKDARATLRKYGVR